MGNPGLCCGQADALAQTQIIAVSGDAAPDGNGSLSSVYGAPALNDVGQTAFHISLTGTTGLGADNFSIVRADGLGFTIIARKGQAAPDGNGTLHSFNAPAINLNGQVV